MIAPRFRKALRDVGGRPGRSLLAMAAMAAGVFEIGTMLYPTALLAPELRSFYGRTHPASAVLTTTGPLTDALVDSVRRVPGVGDAEARPVIAARVRARDDREWTPAAISVVRDPVNPRLDTFTPDRGAPVPGPGDVLLERTALRVAGAAIGDTLTFRLPDGTERRVRIAGTVHAPGLPPAWMEHMVPGFTGWDSALRDGSESAQLRIAVADHALDEGHIHEVADSVRALLERSGRAVARVTVPPPGRHPHADQMEAFLYLLLAFGLLSFGLSTVLVAGMVRALMAEEVREVGVMHALGATSRQIAGVYLAEVAILAAGALAIGVPAGLAAGGAYARFSAGILNADLTTRPFPWAMLAAEIAAGLAIPLLVAMGPVRRAARVGVRAALSDDAAPSSAPAALRAGRLVARLPRPLGLPLRAILDRPGRLVVPVLMLGLGGATLMAALDVAAAWRGAVERDFAGRRFDLLVGFADPQPVDAVRRLLATLPGVTRVECWASASGWIVGPNGVPGGAVTVAGPEAGSALLSPRLLAGRWLAAGDSNAAVVNQAVVRLDPRIAVGRDVTVRLGERTASFRVVGVSAELLPMPLVYAPRPAVLAATRRPGDLTRSAHVVLARHGKDAELAAAREIEAASAGAGMEVSGLQRMADAKEGLLDHLVIIFSVLTLSAAVVVFVAGLALASTLGLRVVQRTREIGILGAIGATPRAIAGQVGLEAAAIGIVGWLAGLLLSVPLSALLEAATGNIFFRAPLPFTVAPGAAVAWLGVVLGLVAAGAFLPMRRAARLTLREALAHA